MVVSNSNLGKRTPPETASLIKRQYLELWQKGNASSESVLEALKERYPDEKFPSPQTINKYIKPYRELLSELNELDTPWSIMSWKKDSGDIPASHIPLLLEIQRYLLIGQLGSFSAELSAHWENKRRISIREAIWISKAADIYEGLNSRRRNWESQRHPDVDLPQFLFSYVQKVWSFAEEYAFEERVRVGEEEDSGYLDMLRSPNILRDSRMEDSFWDLKADIDLARLFGLMDEPEVKEGKELREALTDYDEEFDYERPHEEIGDEEFEFPEVSFGLPNVLIRFNRVSKAARNHDSRYLQLKRAVGVLHPDREMNRFGLRKDVGGLIAELEQLENGQGEFLGLGSALNRIYERREIQPIEDTADKLTKHRWWNDPHSLVVPSNELLPLRFSRRQFRLALRQIPPRDKEGNYKGPHSPDKVASAISYLEAVATELEELISDEIIQELLGITVIDRENGDYPDTDVWCLENKYSLQSINGDRYLAEWGIGMGPILESKTPLENPSWIWCLHCERCFQVMLSDTPGSEASVWEYADELEHQLGEEYKGKVYAGCPYEDCDGDLKDFWWWNYFRALKEDSSIEVPEVPELDKDYPLY